MKIHPSLLDILPLSIMIMGIIGSFIYTGSWEAVAYSSEALKGYTMHMLCLILMTAGATLMAVMGNISHRIEIGRLEDRIEELEEEWEAVDIGGDEDEIGYA